MFLGHRFASLPEPLHGLLGTWQMTGAEQAAFAGPASEIKTAAARRLKALPVIATHLLLSSYHTCLSTSFSELPFQLL